MYRVTGGIHSCVRSCPLTRSFEGRQFRWINHEFSPNTAGHFFNLLDQPCDWGDFLWGHFNT